MLAHHHAHQPHAADPGFSFLRLSAGERLIGVAVALGALWSAVIAIIV